MACVEGTEVEQAALEAIQGPRSNPTGGVAAGGAAAGGAAAGGAAPGGAAPTGGASTGLGGTVGGGGVSAGGTAAGGVAAGGTAPTGGTGGSTVTIPLGSCDFASSACAAKTCEALCTDKSWCPGTCQAIIECVKPSSGGCVTTADPLCGARDDGKEKVCTSKAETGSYQKGTAPPGSAAGAAIEIVQCACAISGTAGAAAK